MTDASLWERIDEPMLRWVASLPSTLGAELYEFDLREGQPFEGVHGLTSREANQSLQRLESHGLIAGRDHPAMGNTTWSRLRVTASGLIVLGEWPDLDRVATAASIHRLLNALAEDAPDEERGALKRAAGAVSRTGDEVVRGTAADIARTLGREAAP